MKVRGLGYIGVSATDPLAWLEFGNRIIGAMPARTIPGEDWLPSEFCEGDLWGHKGLDPVSITESAQKAKDWCKTLRLNATELVIILAKPLRFNWLLV